MVAIVISVVVAVAFMWVIAFTSYGTLVAIYGVLICWGTTMLGGIIFPWRRPEMYQRSPFANWKIGGLPVLSVVCAASLGFFRVGVLPALAGPDSSRS